MTVLCIPNGCHSIDIESTEIGEGTQELYNRVWDAHDAMCRTSCDCVGKVALIMDYERREPYESQRLDTSAAREAESSAPAKASRKGVSA